MSDLRDMFDQRPESASRDLAVPTGSMPTSDARGLPPGKPAEPPRPSIDTVKLKPGEFLPLDYDISGRKPQAEAFDPNDGSLTVKKPLFVDGRNMGEASIRIESAARIYIATASVADALGEKAKTLPRRMAGMLETKSGYLPFNELRAAGIAVEYDATTDRISLSTSS